MTGFSEVYCSGFALASAATFLHVHVNQVPDELQ
jgi:hypothetical protein